MTFFTEVQSKWFRKTQDQICVTIRRQPPTLCSSTWCLTSSRSGPIGWAPILLIRASVTSSQSVSCCSCWCCRPISTSWSLGGERQFNELSIKRWYGGRQCSSERVQLMRRPQGQIKVWLKTLRPQAADLIGRHDKFSCSYTDPFCFV